MAELPIAGWITPPPRGRRIGGAQTLCCYALLLLALAGLAATTVIWRADAADRRGDFSGAVWWRPGVPMYHRQWAEALLFTSPQQAEQQLLDALRLDPYNPLTIADLTTVELALGNWPRAVALTRNQQRLTPDFDDDWRLANLFLARGDLRGFWQEVQIAAPLAEPSDFPSIASRALTASDNDFAALRQALPPTSIAAASAFVAAATATANRPAALQGLAWLLALGPARDDATRAACLRTVTTLVETAWRLWPADAATLWTEAARAGLLPSPPKTTAPPYLADGDFTPADYAALRRWVPDPSDPLGALLGWSWSAPAGVAFHQVLTGDPAHPTAAELLFDGTEADDVDLQQQWILPPPSITMAASAWDRRLENHPEQGLSLRLRDRQGHVLGELPLPLGGDWQVAHGSFAIPAGALQSYLLSLHYHRPNGQMPLKNRILVTQVRLQ